MGNVQNRVGPFNNSILLFAFLLVVWGFYRNLVQLPEEIDELVFKPLIWLVPTFYFFKKEGASWESIGITSDRLFPSVYFAFALAAFFGMEGLIVNFIKHSGFDFSANIGTQAFVAAIGLSFVTAVSEEITFRGYIFNRVWRYMGNQWVANFLTSIGWTLVHLPVAIFVWKLPVAGVISYGLLVFTFSVGASFIFARTKNILAPILLHVFWAWPIILFR